jgi:hypothetical protein
MIRWNYLGICCVGLAASIGAGAEEPVDLDMINKIRYEGFHRSQVMDTLEHLSDVIGSRLTGSPGLAEANEWTREKLESWGLKNTAVEPWGEFGRGWSYSSVSVDMIEPRQTTLFAIPKAWTPGTDGPVEGEVVLVDISEEDDFEKYEGELAGKVLLMSGARELPDVEVTRDSKNAEMRDRYTDGVIPGERDNSWWRNSKKRADYRKKFREFLAEEGVAATVSISGFDYGIISAGSDRSFAKGESTLPPSVTMASNNYNQLVRLVSDDRTVRLRINIDARFHEDDLQAYNTVAEIPGRGPKRNELVLLGAHLDTWQTGTGATDDASGCSVVMEAVRILQAIDARPRRTIRVVLWTGEEQGLLGSRAYVANHFASRPESEDPDELALPAYYRKPLWPITPLRDHRKFSGYFNLDNGAGKILGIYAEDNSAVAPIFEAWLKPFHDVGATVVSSRHTRGTDHMAFDAVGLPAYQFIQDMRDYHTHTHHTTLDDVDHVNREDMIQASVIMASFVYHAAMRDEKMPRKPMPQEPVGWNDEEEEEDGDGDDEGHDEEGDDDGHEDPVDNDDEDPDA